MKSRRGASRFFFTSLLAITMVAVLGPGVAHAEYAQVSPQQAQQYAAMASDAIGSQQQAQPAQSADPFSSVERIRIRSDAIIVTYSPTTKKGKHRTMVIDYSELIPGNTPAKGAAGSTGGGTGGITGMASTLTGGLPTGTLMRYGILAMIGYTLLKKLRRVVRRVTRA